MRQVFGIAVIVAGLAGVLYFGWLRYGITHASDYVWEFDWVIDLADWYDQRFPAPPGSIKFHGELQRVLFSMQVAFGISALLMLVAVLFLRAERPRRLGVVIGWRWPDYRRALKIGFGVLTGVLALSYYVLLIHDLEMRILTFIGIASGVFWYIWVLALAALMVWPRGSMPAGYCSRCGYDLQGNVGTMGCPECGASVWPVTDFPR